VTQAFFIVLAAAVVLSAFTSICLSRLVTSSIGQTISVIKKVAEGDLTQEIRVSSRDEIGDLAQSVNVMCQKMREAVGRSMETSRDLAEAAAQQAASLEESSSSLEQMSAMTRQNADHTAQAKEIMTADGQVIQQTSTAMAGLTQSMKEISEAGDQTQKIVRTIDEIAFQTNLLALNAAVEAARAGEAGAGFAVVADEVRNLAMRAAEAAKNTSQLMGEIVQKTKSGESIVASTNQAFTQIHGRSSKVVIMIGEIAVASQQQSQGIEQINKVVAEMNKVTQHTATSAQELASTMAIFKTHGPSPEMPGRSTGRAQWREVRVEPA
jgi:methyl-accepting chemotaxis protein